MLPRALSAEYSGLMAAPGTPNAVVTPSRSSTWTAASIARIFMKPPESNVARALSGARIVACLATRRARLASE